MCVRHCCRHCRASGQQVGAVVSGRVLSSSPLVDVHVQAMVVVSVRGVVAGQGQGHCRWACMQVMWWSA